MHARAMIFDKEQSEINMVKRDPSTFGSTLLFKRNLARALYPNVISTRRARANGLRRLVAQPIEKHRYKQGCEAFPKICQRVYDFDGFILMDGSGYDPSPLQL
jgi:hypothetical protein